MVLTLTEYAESLAERDLIWPKVPSAKPVRATPSIQPLDGIHVVLWDVYGTLLRVTGGRFCLLPQDRTPLEIAIEKTIREFNMWNSMVRRPGPPWQSMIGQYEDYFRRLAMVATKRRGDYRDVDLVDIWEAIVDRLFAKEYSYDENTMGDVRAYCEKIAFFFHSSLQGLEVRKNVCRAVADLHAVGVLQGFLADGQVFTLMQLLRALKQQSTLPPINELVSLQSVLFSWELGIRKPSRSLFELSVERLKSTGVQPDEILHISCRLETDLIPAKTAGMKTALLAAEQSGLEATTEMLKDATTRPDRLLTDPGQVAALFRIS